jgi:hypothetical protein
MGERAIDRESAVGVVRIFIEYAAGVSPQPIAKRLNSGVRGPGGRPRGPLITKIVIPPGEGLLRVFGNLGEMLATAASGRDVSMLAGVAQSGCGGGI